MTSNKMTIHKALAELKIIDDRIEKSISKSTFCIANKHSNNKVGGIPLADLNRNIQGDYDRSNDLIKRRNAIKRAVVLSNAVTTVNVIGSTYTVAEAIEMKNHGITFKEMLYDTMLGQYNKAVADVKRNNGTDLDTKAEAYVIGIYGSKDGKVDTEDFKKAKRDFIESNSFEMIDPLNIKEKLDALEAETCEFKAEIDAVLSTSNALTEIEITY